MRSSAAALPVGAMILSSLAEGARHPDGLPIRAETITEILRVALGVEARVTVLGHVQRGGSPSAFDRCSPAGSAQAAVEYIAGDPIRRP